MTTKMVNLSSPLSDGGGTKKQFNLKEESNVTDFNKEEGVGWNFGGSIKINTLHKNDLKRGQLIDEISDLRDVLRRSCIGPLSREIIDLSDQFHQNMATEEEKALYDSLARHEAGEGGLSHSKSNTSISSSSSRQPTDEERQLHENIERELSMAASDSSAMVTINKEKLAVLMKEYKRTKEDLKDHSSHLAEIDNQLLEAKGDLELKRKKIQLLKTGNTPVKPTAQKPPIHSASVGKSASQQLDLSPSGGRKRSPTITPNHQIQQQIQSQANGQQHQQHQQQQQQQQQSSPSLGKKDNSLNTSINNLLHTAATSVITEDINQKISEVLNTAKYRIERIQFKNRVLLTSSLHNLSTEIHTILERRITKKQVNAELQQNAQIVGDCDSVRTTIVTFMSDLTHQVQMLDLAIDEAAKKKMFKSKEKSKRVLELERNRKQVESAIAFLKIEKRSVRELRDRFVSVCNEVTKLYEVCNSVERDLSKWDIELERIYLKLREGYFSDYFKLHPVFQSCTARIKDHYAVKQDLIRELARREAARIASEIYVSGIVQILECGTDLITDERMVDVARVRGLEHQVHMLYHALHDQQTERSYLVHSINGTNLPQYNNHIIHNNNYAVQQQAPASQHSPNHSPKSSPKNTTNQLPANMAGITMDHKRNSFGSNPMKGSTGSTGSVGSSSGFTSNHNNNINNSNNNTNNHTTTPPTQIVRPATNILKPAPLVGPITNKKDVSPNATITTPPPVPNATVVVPVVVLPSPVVKAEPPKPLPTVVKPVTPVVAPTTTTTTTAPVTSSAANKRTEGPPGSMVMEIMIRNFESLFPINSKSHTSPILIKTSGYLDTISDLSADILIQSASIASNEGRVYSDSLKVNGNMIGADQVDVYMTSELLKHFFKTVDPFLTKTLFQEWLLAERFEDPEQRISAIRELITKLSEENKSIIGSLLRMLNKVVGKALETNPNNNPIPALSRAFSSLILRTGSGNEK
eukprot:gene9728-11360_t